MPFTNKGLWVPSDYTEPSQPKVSTQGRPHNWTILLALVQPFITVVAVAVAFYSLRENNKNFMVANRAYFSLEHKTTVDANRINVELALENVGLTPATEVELFVSQPLDLPVNRKAVADLKRVADISYMEPKRSSRLESRLKPIQLSGDPFVIGYHLSWTDVFRKRWGMSVCTWVDMKNGVAKACPADLVMPAISRALGTGVGSVYR